MLAVDLTPWWRKVQAWVLLSVAIQEFFKAQWTENPVTSCQRYSAWKRPLLPCHLRLLCFSPWFPFTLPFSPLCHHPHCAVSRSLPFLSKHFSCPWFASAQCLCWHLFPSPHNLWGNCLDHLFFASFAPLLSVISMSICPSVTCPLLLCHEAVESTVNSGTNCSVLLGFFLCLELMISVCLLLPDLLLRPCHQLYLLFLFAVVNSF